MKPEERRQMLADAYAHLVDKDKAILAYPIFHAVNWGSKMSYRGLTPFLDCKRLVHDFRIDDDTTTEDVIETYRELAREQRQLEKPFRQGFLIDRPIKAMIDEAGISTSELVEKIRDIRLYPPDSGSKSIKIKDTIFDATIQNGVITGLLTLGDSPYVRWQNGTVRADETRIPEALKASMVGKTVREVIDHRWLDGLTIRRASGKNILTLHVVERPIPAGAHDVLTR